MGRRLTMMIPLLLLSVGGSGAFAASSEYFHPSLTSGTTKVRRVLVLPVRAEVTRVGVKGAEPMLEESDELAGTVGAAVNQAFEQHGISLIESPFEPTDEARPDPEVMGRHADFEARFDQLRPFLQKKPKDIRQGRYSLGDQVAELVPGSDADAFVVVRASAARQTKGKSWLSGDIFNLSRFQSTSVELTLIDAHTGEVLGLFQITGGPSVEKGVAKSVAKLPRR